MRKVKVISTKAISSLIRVTGLFTEINLCVRKAICQVLPQEEHQNKYPLKFVDGQFLDNFQIAGH